MEKKDPSAVFFLSKPSTICFCFDLVVCSLYYYSYRTDSHNVLSFITQKVSNSFEYTFWRKTTDLLKIMNR